MRLLKFLDSFMKTIVVIVVFHGLICVTLSYILAFQDHVVIAENLSQTMITEIIAPIVAYTIKSTIENVSKYNNWIDRIKGDQNGSDNNESDGGDM